jgi:hypothetical protein
MLFRVFFAYFVTGVLGCFLIVPLSISQFLDTPTKLMKLRLEILEILYNFVAASTPVSATVKKFSAGHIFGFLYINCVLARVGRFKFDFNKLPCRFCSTCLHIRNRETSGYLLLAGDDDNPCRLNTVRLCPEKTRVKQNFITAYICCDFMIPKVRSKFRYFLLRNPVKVASLSPNGQQICFKHFRGSQSVYLTVFDK